jgi:beta-barrel assembly-enhancing protease
MKHWGAFALTLVLLGAALIASQKQRIDAPVAPDAVLSLIADSEHELTRLPASFTRMSDLDEIKAGDRLAKEYERWGNFAQKLPTTPTVQAYVNRVGARVAAGAERKLPYRFHYISDPNFVNAFALPGGHVFIGGGLMALMDSEDELAAVLGHEVEHIDLRHCAERVQRQAALEKIPLGELVAIPVEVFEEGYSKTQELEADREGTHLAVRARYSPLGAVRMFQTFDRLYQARTRRAQSPQEELSDLAWETLEGYFRSHPLPSERVAQIQTMISDNHWESLTSEQPLQVEYVYLTQRAGRDLEARQFAAAESAATRSLNLHPGQIDALTILAQAQFALMEFSAALYSYHQLLKDHPSAAAEVAEFANSIAQSTLNTRHFEPAAKFASASLDLQPNNAPALIVLAEAQMEMADYAAAGATYQRLISRYPSDAESVITYITWSARNALGSHHYQQARDKAAFELSLRPNESEPLRIEADAALALADFPAAAKAFRGLIDLTPKDSPVNMELVWSYADALSAAGSGQGAVSDFRSLVETSRPESTSTVENEIRIEYAGLSLMAGDAGAANEMVAHARGVGGSWIPPELMTRLGWWYYRAGNYSEAEALLDRLAQERPGNGSVQNDLSWSEMESNQFDAAIQRFSSAEGWQAYGFGQWNTPQMGMAVAFWRSHRADDALKNYEPAVNAEPRWTNPTLVRAFYSPTVAESVAEMQAELAKRVEARKRQGRIAR